MTPFFSIEDLRAAARRRVPRMFFDYIESGASHEITLKRNLDAFACIGLRQRVGINVEHRSLSTDLLNAKVSMPLALAPTGLAGMVHADGEILAAQAAAACGVPFALSTMSICSIEDLASESKHPFWFQLYVFKDRDFVRRLIARARAARCSALMVTMDLPVMGLRYRDVRNGLSAPPRLHLGNLADLIRRPHWCLGMLKTRRRSFGNIIGHAAGVTDTTSLASWTTEQLTPALTWQDIDWIKREWDGPLIIKGILDPEDAKLARAAGADAIVVSNHGGRQLDGAPASIRQLPAIVDAVGGDLEIYLDSGVRSGQDILKALALGARAALIGRAFLYGLGARGRDGVSCCLELMRTELDRSMALCGATDVRTLRSGNSVCDI